MCEVLCCQIVDARAQVLLRKDYIVGKCECKKKKDKSKKERKKESLRLQIAFTCSNQNLIFEKLFSHSSLLCK